MRALQASDILSNEVFVAERRRLEREVLHAKELRRLHAGPHFTFLFENRATLLWQIQEMCRVEHIVAPAAVAHELETYGALLPGRSELSTTLLVEYDDPPVRDRMLQALHGVQDCVRIEIQGAGPVLGKFDPEQFNVARISSVQFVRFPLTDDQRTAFLDLGRKAVMRIDHPAYRDATVIPPSMRGALVEDLLD